MSHVRESKTIEVTDYPVNTTIRAIHFQIVKSWSGVFQLEMSVEHSHSNVRRWIGVTSSVSIVKMVGVMEYLSFNPEIAISEYSKKVG